MMTESTIAADSSLVLVAGCLHDKKCESAVNSGSGRPLVTSFAVKPAVGDPNSSFLSYWRPLHV